MDKSSGQSKHSLHFGHTNKTNKNKEKKIKLHDISHKCVNFQKSVEIFKINDGWKLQKQQSNLKTEKEQAERRLKHRND